MDTVNSVLAFLNSGSGLAISAVVLEGILRLVKTDKPLSILRGVRAVLGVVDSLVLGLEKYLDAVIPQNVDKGK